MHGEIKVTFNSAGRTGKQSKSISVLTNDPENEKVKLDIEGNVVMLLRARPNSLDFKNVYRGETKTMDLKVIPLTDARFDILQLESTGPQFEAEIVDASDIGYILKSILLSTKQRMAKRFGNRDPAVGVKPGTRPPKPRTPETEAPEKGARTVSVRILPTAPLGRHSEVLKIHTDLKDKPLLQVRLFANVLGNITIEPKTAYFGAVHRDEGKQATFKIAARKPASLEITRVETSPDYVKPELLVVTPGSEYELELTVEPGAPIGMINGTVLVHTSDQDQPEIKIGFYANVVE
jgi:hypothetical protein